MTPAEERILAKLDELNKYVAEINITMALNTQSLEIHIKRTNLLEEKLKPVEDHVKSVQAWARLTKAAATGVVAAAAFMVSVAKLLGMI